MAPLGKRQKETSTNNSTRHVKVNKNFVSKAAENSIEHLKQLQRVKELEKIIFDLKGTKEDDLTMRKSWLKEKNP